QRRPVVRSLVRPADAPRGPDPRRLEALADRAAAGREAPSGSACDAPCLAGRPLLAAAGRPRLQLVADRNLRAVRLDALVDLEHMSGDLRVRMHLLDVLPAAPAELRERLAHVHEPREHVLEPCFGGP